MKAQISQQILVEVAGSLSRRKVVRSLTRIRHRLEREVCDGSVVSGEDMSVLVSICRDLGLTEFESIEVLGSTFVTDKAHALLTPEDAPIADWDSWFEEHLDSDLGMFEILNHEYK